MHKKARVGTSGLCNRLKWDAIYKNEVLYIIGTRVKGMEMGQLGEKRERKGRCLGKKGDEVEREGEENGERGMDGEAYPVSL